jgi:hypothetical protein
MAARKSEVAAAEPTNPLHEAALSVGKHVVPKGSAIGGELIQLLIGWITSLITNRCNGGMSPARLARRAKSPGLITESLVYYEALRLASGDRKMARKYRDAVFKAAEQSSESKLVEVIEYARAQQAGGDDVDD